ncbi:sensor histidine kinase [Paenibacillus sp. M.A.Huq-81]
MKALWFIHALFPALLIYVCVQMHAHPFMGIYIENRGNYWVVSKVDKECGVSAHYGIEKGDILLQINGRDPSLNDNVSRWHIAEGFKHASFLKPEGEIVRIIINDWLKPQSVHGALPYVVLALFIWMVGNYALYKCKQSPSKIFEIFLALNQVSALVVLTAFPASSGIWLAKVAHIVSAAWIPSLLLALLSRFPVPSKSPLLAAARTFGLAVGFLYTAAILLYVSADFSSSAMIAFFRYGLPLCIGLSFLIGIGIAVRNMAKMTIAANRAMSVILLAGTCLALFVPLLFTFLPEELNEKPILMLEVSMFSYLVLPLIFLYAIAKRSELNIDVHMREMLGQGTEGNCPSGRGHHTDKEWLDPSLACQLLIRAQEQEKQRVSSHLHDQILQNLIFMLRDLEKAGDFGKSAAAGPNVLLESMKDAIYDVRELCSDLYPSMIEDLGLKSAMNWLVRETKSRHNVAIEWEFGQVEEERLPYEVKVSLFRILKELVTNALKHAGASRMFIRIEPSGQMLVCEIRDNGVGFDVPRRMKETMRGNHFGLMTALKRIHGMGGTMNILSKLGEGTKVTFQIPLLEGGA